jgi:hypothetical protein
LLTEWPILHPLPLVWGVHQDVGCHAGHDAAVHFRSPLHERQLAVHDHHQVQVGERVSPSAGVRTKENDFPRAHLAELLFDAVQLALEEVGVVKSVARGLPSSAVGSALVPVLNTGGVGHRTVSLPLRTVSARLLTVGPDGLHDLLYLPEVVTSNRSNRAIPQRGA